MDIAQKRKRNKLIYILSKTALNIISAYYIFLLVFGMTVTIYIMIHLRNLNNDNLLFYTVIISLAVCGMLCSIQYLKCIYKACMDGRVLSPTEKQKMIQTGNILYFVLRPIFAFVFVIIAIFAILSGFIILTTSLDFILNDRFLYLCVIVSCFIGFSIGRVLDGFEALSTGKVDKILQYEEGENDYDC